VRGTSEANRFGVAGLLDVLSRQDIGKGKSFALQKRSQDGLEGCR